MKYDTLSAFPYYGGKARMARFISEMLDYNNTDTYIEPFGGGCRVLLNKPRHAFEIYNDSSFGLCAFFKFMSSPIAAQELINALYKTEYSLDCFNYYLDYRNKFDDSMIRQTSKEYMQYWKSLLVKYNYITKYDDRQTFLLALKNIYKSGDHPFTLDEKRKLVQLYNNQKRTKNAMDTAVAGGLEIPYEWTEVPTEDAIYDVELAVATYVVYSQSRDAMGNTWTKSKYKTQEAYYKQIDRLYEVADRFNGVTVFDPQSAIAFLLDTSYLYKDNVMIYLDPSYLKPEDEQKAKKKIINKNLGSPYKQSFTYEDHKALLELISDKNVKCKILISNYDVDLYNDYLTSANKWKRVGFETTTSVGSKRDNKRTEVLWYNY